MISLHYAPTWMAATLLLALAAPAVAIDAPVAGDTFVTSANALSNYGGLSNLYVGNGATVLIQFDLSSLPAGTTAGQIGKATMTLYVNRINTSGLVSVQPVSASWSESAVTYATGPAHGTALATFTPTVAESFVVVDVTALVQSWVTTPAGNFGIALTSTAADVLFDAKEND